MLYLTWLYDIKDLLISSLLNIPFPSSKEAEIAFKTLSVDPEPRKDVIKKLSVDNTTLNM